MVAKYKPLSWIEIKARALEFAKEWAGEQREGAEAQTFWNDFFDVFGVRRRTVAAFEEKVRNIKGQFGFIDLFWRGKLLAEHKSYGKSLDKAASQAFEYIQCLKDENRDDEIPRYVIVSDFAKIVLYDLEPVPEDGDPPVLVFPIKDLHKHVHAFAFIPGYKIHHSHKEDAANIKAAELMGRVHDALAISGYSGHALERFLVRVLFCLFAEDTGIFEPNAFTTFVEQNTREDGTDLGPQLAQLFDVLDTPEPKRQKNLDELLASFRYVNGGLFEETLRIPACNRAIRDAILTATRFDWCRISPAVFGSLFQSVMDPEARRRCGAHYTTEENIMKVIRPLFLDELRAEFEKYKSNKNKLQEFHAKLASLTFFDPACGCGNFLVLAYRELRLLEMDVLEVLFKKGERFLGSDFISQVNVDQFYGIEIVEFPVRIAETALWLMDHQMNMLASERFGQYYVRLPLKKSAKIVFGNALRIDWNDVLSKQKCSYILGNPPFVGAKYQDAVQKEDIRLVFGKMPNVGLLDYVSCWYFKAAEYIQNTHIQVGYVSTNSITQGEQVGVLWSFLFDRGINIRFAYRTFVWSSEAKGKAHVHCVIIGFSLSEPVNRWIFESDGNTLTKRKVARISRYLVDADDIVVTNRREPLCDVPKLAIGNKPIDGGHYLFSDEEKVEFIKLEPKAAPLFRKWLGAKEFINGWNRWCLWVGDCSPSEIRSMPEVRKRVKAVRQYRQNSTSIPTQKIADKPARFHVENMPTKRYLVIPEVSSERRSYIPIAFLSPSVLASNKLRILRDATLWHFGILTSAMHMAWNRQVGGRRKSDYQYSVNLVYNNFPWATNVSATNRKRVEEKAKAVLEARKQFSDSSLADMYDPDCMPPALAKAHRELDKAVDRCYRSKAFRDEQERLEFLFARYEKLIATS